QQWQFMVPTSSPQNVGDPYANNVRVPLVAVITPRNVGGVLGLLTSFLGNLQNAVLAALGGDPAAIADRIGQALASLGDDLQALVTGSGAAAIADLADDPANVTDTLEELADNVGEILGLPGNLFGSGNGLRAGVAVVDMTPDVGYCAGQYCDSTDLPDELAGG